MVLYGRNGIYSYGMYGINVAQPWYMESTNRRKSKDSGQGENRIFLPALNMGGGRGKAYIRPLPRLTQLRIISHTRRRLPFTVKRISMSANPKPYTRAGSDW